MSSLRFPERQHLPRRCCSSGPRRRCCGASSNLLQATQSFVDGSGIWKAVDRVRIENNDIHRLQNAANILATYPLAEIKIRARSKRIELFTFAHTVFSQSRWSSADRPRGLSSADHRTPSMLPQTKRRACAGSMKLFSDHIRRRYATASSALAGITRCLRSRFPGRL